MKKLLALYLLFPAVLLLAAPNQAVRNNISFTSQEIAAAGDFNGDGLLDYAVVDRGPGSVRVGYQKAGGILNWSESRLCGIPNVSSIAVGRPDLPGIDRLFVTSPFANRIHWVDLSHETAPLAPTDFTSLGLGPTQLIALDIDYPGNDTAEDELVVLSTMNNPPASDALKLYPLDDDGILFAILADLAIPAGPPRQLSRVRLRSGLPYTTGLTHSNQFTVFDTRNHPSFPVVDTVGGLPENGFMLNARWDQRDDEFQFMFFAPGDSSITVSAVTPSLGLAAPVTHALAKGYASIAFAESPSGPGFIAMSADKLEADFYLFDGVQSPTLRQTLTTDAENPFTFLLQTDSDSFELLHQTADGEASVLSSRYDWNGNAFILSDINALPRGQVPHRGSVIYFNQEPFVQTDTPVIHRRALGDWTRVFTFTQGGASNQVRRLESQSPEVGLLEIGPEDLPTPVSAQFGWANQINDHTSVYDNGSRLGTQTGFIDIEPPPGAYSSYFRITLLPSTGIETTYYRFSPDEAWQIYSGPIGLPSGAKPFTLFTYGDVTDVGPTPIFRGTYQWSLPPEEMDSDSDGLPDFVEVVYGIDPQSSDGDNDGYHDLEELISNIDPNDPLASPANRDTIAWQQSYNLRVHPMVHDTNTPFPPNFLEGQTGEYVRVYNNTGSLVAENPVVEAAGGSNGVQLVDIPLDPEDLFSVVATPPSFVTDDGQRLGREMMGLYPHPIVRLPSPNFTYNDSADDISEAIRWLSNALSFFPTIERTTIVDESFDLFDSLAFVLSEKIIGDLLFERGTIGTNEISLAAFRDRDTRYVPSQQELLSLQLDPGYRIHTLINSVHEQIMTNTNIRVSRLRRVCSEVYRTAGLQNDTNSIYASPITALRHFVSEGTLPGTASSVSYAADIALAPGVLNSAFDACAYIRSLIALRPTVTIEVLVNAQTGQSSCTQLESATDGSAINLIDARANPYDLPGGAPLPPGARLLLHGYTDRAGECGGLDVEVISLRLIELPSPPLDDADGNLLSDEWELALLGSAGASALGDHDNDGYSDLEESLAGTDPTRSQSLPTGAPLDLSPPEIRIETMSDGSIRLHWDYPGEVSERIGFRILSANELGPTQFSDDNFYGAFMGGQNWQSLLPAPTGDRQFFAFRMYLR